MVLWVAKVLSVPKMKLGIFFGFGSECKLKWRNETLSLWLGCNWSYSKFCWFCKTGFVFKLLFPPIIMEVAKWGNNNHMACFLYHSGHVPLNHEGGKVYTSKFMISMEKQRNTHRWTMFSFCLIKNQVYAMVHMESAAVAINTNLVHSCYFLEFSLT